jgi:hypothetical protein
MNKKFTVYKLWNAEGRGALGRYFSKSGRAVLYMIAISMFAVETGSDGDDLSKLVEYHEEAHHLQIGHGLTVATKMSWPAGEKPQSEIWADEYAWRKFYKVHGRWANVKGWM